MLIKIVLTSYPFGCSCIGVGNRVADACVYDNYLSINVSSLSSHNIDWIFSVWQLTALFTYCLQLVSSVLLRRHLPSITEKCDASCVRELVSSQIDVKKIQLLRLVVRGLELFIQCSCTEGLFTPKKFGLEPKEMECTNTKFQSKQTLHFFGLQPKEFWCKQALKAICHFEE